ncbi:MAG: universal stress protein [Deltaproteobacteria bacterium]|nr:universal stress protein [Deltaproteobacteria bacterium]
MAEFKNILVTTDFSDSALGGVQSAKDLAAPLGAQLHLLYVADLPLPSLTFSSEFHRQEIQQEHLRRAQEELSSYVEKHLAGLDVRPHLMEGNAAEKIVVCANEVKADLIVMATHGYGSVGKLVFGSTTLRVLHKSPCPVVAVRADSD